jgi:hypothetical protein
MRSSSEILRDFPPTDRRGSALPALALFADDQAACPGPMLIAILLASSRVSSCAAVRRLILIMHVAQRLSAVVAHDEAGAIVFNIPGRREAARLALDVFHQRESGDGGLLQGTESRRSRSAIRDPWPLQPNAVAVVAPFRNLILQSPVRAPTPMLPCGSATSSSLPRGEIR